MRRNLSNVLKNMGSRLVGKQSPELACEVNSRPRTWSVEYLWRGTSFVGKWGCPVSCQQCLVRWLATIVASATIWLFRGCNLFKGYRSETAASLSLFECGYLSIFIAQSSPLSPSLSTTTMSFFLTAIIGLPLYPPAVISRGAQQ